jgi:E3 ubiquitin-protein ligase RNF144
MSSFLASVRKLFAKEDAESGEPEAKRSRLEEPRAAAAASSSSSSSNLDGQIPPDYPARLNRLIQIGWQPKFAAKALQTAQYDVEAAAAALQKAHPITQQPSAGIELNSEPTKFERLLALPRNNNIVSITPSTSIAPYSSATSSTSSSSSASSSHLYSTSTSPQISPAVPRTFECTSCTFLNDIESMRCEICNEPRHLTKQQSAAIASTVQCCICFIHQPPETMFQPAAAAACKHYVCVEDARLYLESRVDQGHVTGLQCAACPRELSTAEIRAGLDEPGYARYARFKRLNELSKDPSVIFCPSARCEIALFHTTSDRLTCPDCNHSICFACKVPWHTGMTCAGYRYTESIKSEQQKLASLSASERLFQRFLERNPGHFRQCRKCTAYVEKIDGCDKMTCRCGERWCQKCGIANAACQCTPSSHIFYSQEHVLNNFGRPSGRPSQAVPTGGSFGLPGLLQSLMYSSSVSAPAGYTQARQLQP